MKYTLKQINIPQFELALTMLFVVTHKETNVGLQSDYRWYQIANDSPICVYDSGNVTYFGDNEETLDTLERLTQQYYME